MIRSQLNSQSYQLSPYLAAVIAQLELMLARIVRLPEPHIVFFLPIYKLAPFSYLHAISSSSLNHGRVPRFGLPKANLPYQ
jgi:hypothetical protein